MKTAGCLAAFDDTHAEDYLEHASSRADGNRAEIAEAKAALAPLP